MNKLGAVPLSSDIFQRSRIGLWAFELDEGAEPRMYVDDTMLDLIGLKKQTTPEKTYHAWYDHIDQAHYGFVAVSVAKMVAGEHSEVQYPWHHPDGRTIIVRCGGTRNFAYTKGVRVEGCHQDVTEMVHVQKEEIERVARDRYFSIIDALSADFDSVYEINLSRDEAVAYKVSGRVTEIFGGEIKIESELGKGTTITVLLPLRILDKDSSAIAASELIDTNFLQGKRILLVDDNEMNREIAKDILEGYGIEVEEAEDGDVAVEKLRKIVEDGHPFYYDCVLMDIQMPRMDGYEAVKLIRATPGTEDYHLPIVALSANAFEEDKRKSFTAGMDAHLSKPINVLDLVGILARLLQH